MSNEKIYTVTWKEKGKPQAERFTDYMSAEQRTRALSMGRGVGPVYIESRVRYIHARWENGAQTLSRSFPLIGDLTEP